MFHQFIKDEIMSHSRNNSNDESLAKANLPTSTFLGSLFGSIAGLFSSIVSRRPYTPSKWFKWSIFGASAGAGTQLISKNAATFFAGRMVERRQEELMNGAFEKSKVSAKN